MNEAYKPPLESINSPKAPKKPFSIFWVVIEVTAVFLIIGVLVGMLWPMRRGVPEAARRVLCQNNLRQIALAFHNYKTRHGHYPSAYIADENGKPIHSWRVLILPFMEQQPLYDEYSMDEPWNGPNNRTLADKIVDVYRCRSHNVDDDSFATSYCLVTGRGTAFADDKQPVTEVFNYRDNGAVFLVETNRDNIHWMEPRDLSIDQAIEMFANAANNGLQTNHPGFIHVAYADGSVEKLDVTTPPAELRKLFSIDDELDSDK